MRTKTPRLGQNTSGPKTATRRNQACGLEKEGPARSVKMAKRSARIATPPLSRQPATRNERLDRGRRRNSAPLLAAVLGLAWLGVGATESLTRSTATAAESPCPACPRGVRVTVEVPTPATGVRVETCTNAPTRCITRCEKSVQRGDRCTLHRRAIRLERRTARLLRRRDRIAGAPLELRYIAVQACAPTSAAVPPAR